MDNKKQLWIIANWKSNKTIAEGLEWIAKVGPSIEKRPNLKIVVCPEIVALEEVKKAVMVGNYPLIVGVQDLSPYAEGAHTGEEPARDLTNIAELSILGHSERRTQFGETDEMVTEKANQALKNKIIPLVCVQGKETPIPENVKLVAYEPIFAIGTGSPDTPENADMVAKSLKDKYGEEIEVLYGGSVTSANVKQFIVQSNLAGVLVGKASLEAEEFIKIIEACYVI